MKRMWRTVFLCLSVMTVEGAFPMMRCEAGTTNQLFTVEREAGTTNEPCAVEMGLVKETEMWRPNNREAARSNDWAKWRIANEWDGKTGATVQGAVELLQYMVEGNTNRWGSCTRIEVRWATGDRGVVKQVWEGTNGSGETVHYLFKYGGSWHKLLIRGGGFN